MTKNLKNNDSVDESSTQEQIPQLPTPEELGLLSKLDGDNHEEQESQRGEKEKKAEGQESGESGREIHNDGSSEASEDSEESVEHIQDDLSETELKALAKGWNPKEQHNQENGEWKSAKVFLEHGELMDSIAKSNKTIKSLKKSMHKMGKLVQNQSKRLSEKELNAVKEARRDAIELGDASAVETYDNQIMDYHKEINDIDQSFDPGDDIQEIPPEVQDFADKNSSWFNNNTEQNTAMKLYAIQKENELMATYPSMSIAERLSRTESAVKDTFKLQFDRSKDNDKNNTHKNPKIQTVEGSNRLNNPKVNKNKVTFNSLPREARNIVNQFVRYAPNLSKDDYAQQLVDNDVIKL